MVEITLPRAYGSPERYRLGGSSAYPRTAPANSVRTVYADAHVVADPLRLIDPRRVSAVDWDATLAFPRHLWDSVSRSRRRMVGGAESARGILHCADLFRLADRAGLFHDPELAARRMAHLCAINGVA